MYTVLIIYKEFQDAPHALLDGEWIEKSQIVKCFELTDLNNRFKNIIKIDILEKIQN